MASRLRDRRRRLEDQLGGVEIEEGLGETHVQADDLEAIGPSAGSQRASTARRLDDPMEDTRLLEETERGRQLAGTVFAGNVGAETGPVLRALLTRQRQQSIIDLSGGDMSKQAEVPYGTLDLLILKTLESMGTLHGYRIARRIEQVSQDALRLSQGSIYPALVRLEQEGWIRTEWGVSETNRKVKLYSLTKAGRKQVGLEVAKWEQANALVARFLEEAP